MKINALHISHQELVERLAYDPDTGVFVWKEAQSFRRGWNKRFAGKVAGVLSNGRVSIRVDYQRYPAARLAWIYVTGAEPCGEIDHINCNPLDNRFANLRDATRAENAANIRCPSHNTSGVKGVAWDKARGKWKAYATINGRMKNIGRFSSKEEASSAYMREMAAVHGAFARAA